MQIDCKGRTMTRILHLGFVLALIGCGGGESGAPGSISPADESAMAAKNGSLPPGASKPSPSPTPTPTPTPVSTENPFANFDFKQGSAYPARAAVTIGSIEVPIGATEVFVPIRLDRPTPNTIIGRVLTRNGSGSLAGIEGTHFQRTLATVVFRPGDPLEQTVRVPLLRMDSGRQFELIFPEGVAGGSVAAGTGRITAVSGAAPTTAATGAFRQPRVFNPTGILSYQMAPSTMKWSDSGASDTWRTRLSHGRTQPGNAETGLYLDPVLHTSPLPPFAIENNEIVIRSQQLISPIFHDNKYWYHGAAILTGQRMPSTQVQYGQYEWTAMMPNRRGGWPAFWLLPTSGAWPPEIDVYEGFGYSTGWNFSRQIAANIHGGANGTRTFTALMQVDAANVYSMSGFDTSYHRYAVDIAPDFITWFVDGKETYQTVNPFRGTTWYPLMNVAVKHSGDYVGGTGEMRVKSFAAWKATS